MNLYGYCQGGPVGAVDPSGLRGDSAFLDWGSDFFGGWGDALTFGLTRWARNMNPDLADEVDQDSGWYHAGEAVGTVHGALLMPAESAPEGAVLIMGNGGRKLAPGLQHVFGRPGRRNSDVVDPCGGVYIGSKDERFYVGEGKDLVDRPFRGHIDRNQPIDFIPVPGGKQVRRGAEQVVMDSLGGILGGLLANKRNAIAPKKRGGKR